MKNYTEMSIEEIREIAMRGGDRRVKLNTMVSNHLDSLDLSEDARMVIDGTGIDTMAEVFGGLFTAEEVEELCKEYYED